MLQRFLNIEVFQWIKYLTDKKMGKLRLQQVRSRIKRPIDQKRTLDALGLKKMNQVVEVEATPQIQGMVKKVQHLLKVETL